MSLELAEPSVATRAILLSDFYFNGLPGFDPIVQPENYGMVPVGTPTGQVRTNQFMGGPWNLREFKIEEACDPLTGDCLAVFRQTSVKGNPSPTLWDGSSATYNADFVAQMALLMPIEEDINRLGKETPEQYNTGESISQFSSSNNFASYSASGALQTAIATALPGTSFLDVADVSERAQTQTCGGCHQTSSNANLGNQFGGLDLFWPAQAPSFVHIDEGSTLSLALTQNGGFLDQRKQVMEEFLLLTCDEPCLTTPIVVGTDGSLMTSEEAEMVEDKAKIIAPTKSSPLLNTLSGRLVH